MSTATRTETEVSVEEAFEEAADRFRRARTALDHYASRMHGPKKDWSSVAEMNRLAEALEDLGGE